MLGQHRGTFPASASSTQSSFTRCLICSKTSFRNTQRQTCQRTSSRNPWHSGTPLNCCINWWILLTRIKSSRTSRTWRYLAWYACCIEGLLKSIYCPCGTLKVMVSQSTFSKNHMYPYRSIVDCNPRPSTLRTPPAVSLLGKWPTSRQQPADSCGCLPPYEKRRQRRNISMIRVCSHVTQ